MAAIRSGEVKAIDSVFAAFELAAIFQQLQMGQRFRHGEAPFMRREAIHALKICSATVNRLRAGFDGVVRVNEPLIVMGEQLFDAAAPICDQPFVSGQGQTHVKIFQRMFSTILAPGPVIRDNGARD